MPIIGGVVASVTPLTERITEFRVQSAGETPLPPFEPGAHIRVSLPEGGDRAYSLIRTGPVAEPLTEYRIAVQLEPDGDGGSRYMHGLKPGDRIEFASPKNDFPLDASQPAVLLAGGIGVTPLISMATQLTEAGQDFDFHYAARSAALMAYPQALAEQFGPRFHSHFDDQPGNALDLGAVIDSVGKDRHLYICGPRGLIDVAKASAEAAGIPASRIHIELFDNAAQQDGDTAFEVELSSTGQVFTVAPDQSIIEALEAGGVDVLYDCQRGDCGICQCDVISGTPDHRDVVLSEDERASGKVMQICVSRAKSPRLVLDL